MDNAVIIYAFLVSIIFIWFSKNQKYYKKTVDTYGNKFADMTFNILKLCGYLMLSGGIIFLIISIYSKL